MSKAHRLVAGIVTALLTVSLAACGGGGGGGAVATVNGQSISHGELDSKLEGSPAARGVLQNLVMSMLIDQYAQQHHITVSQNEINKVEDQYKAQYPGDQWNQTPHRSRTERTGRSGSHSPPADHRQGGGR